MHVTLVHVHCKAEFVDAFVQATRINHENSIREPGNLRFDVLRDHQDVNRFYLYEVYRTEADAKHHKQTPHYLVWRDTVEKMMAEPRRGIPYVGIFPEV
ncbi:MAG: lsrG [H] [Magnetococcales bacterium]|nr:lsrG [H] [Magnetococcales bacterium]HIJ85606.1 antibiotic biosynthesis monooxygenase [Magnetococcales bacterium]